MVKTARHWHLITTVISTFGLVCLCFVWLLGNSSHFFQHMSFILLVLFVLYRTIRDLSFKTQYLINSVDSTVEPCGPDAHPLPGWPMFDLLII